MAFSSNNRVIISIYKVKLGWDLLASEENGQGSVYGVLVVARWRHQLEKVGTGGQSADGGAVGQLSKDAPRNVKRQKDFAIQMEQQQRLARVAGRKQLPRAVGDLPRSGAGQ